MIGQRMGHFKEGTVFEQPDEKRAQRLLEITPPVVAKAVFKPVTEPKGKGKGKGKNGKGGDAAADDKPQE